MEGRSLPVPCPQPNPTLLDLFTVFGHPLFARVQVFLEFGDLFALLVQLSVFSEDREEVVVDVVGGVVEEVGEIVGTVAADS